ncbi:tetratricopeptide repeat protein [Cupriavidus sp. IDO]|uniref:tetratricopeptide repeat protein n=1 Tax=Cupriavidus sp. IDO TaxID=1539142 RepID=UPI0005794661|nr:tetratricopeptide repeat protein [Cupriavidus sp. IDO]KWR90438.1 hypothetical protein RM96_09440 [Cupriavidus sp. IDO]
MHFNLGVAREDIGALQSALAAYERCIELAPDDADAHYKAARLHQEVGHFQNALRHFDAFWSSTVHNAKWVAARSSGHQPF